MAVSEVTKVLAESAGKGKNRFSKKAFNKLLTAMINDDKFVTNIAVVKNKELAEVQEDIVSVGFRKFLKKVIEKAGIDKSESEIVMQPDFTIDDVDGLYELMETAIYTYMDEGRSKFDFRPREDFKGSIEVSNVAAVEDPEPRDVKNPQTGEYLGTYKYKSKAYKKLCASSSCPAYLKTRERVK